MADESPPTAAYAAASIWPSTERRLAPRAAALMAARLEATPPADWPVHLGPSTRAMLAGHAAELAAWIAARQARRPMHVVGISGGQGSGKSTLTGLTAALLSREYGRTVACLSLDDLYLTRSEREALARDVHPLLRTRGVPGTHDPLLGKRLLDALRTGHRPVALPRFDKASDDRLAEDLWPTVRAPVDVVLFEGWCVGVEPEPEAALAEPVNELERAEDPDGRWRRAVNVALGGDYADLFARLDGLVMLKVPDFSAVGRWREAQERELRRHSGSAMTPAGVERFVAHYERLTRHALREVPQRSDLVLELDSSHAVVAVASGSGRRRD